MFPLINIHNKKINFSVYCNSTKSQCKRNSILPLIMPLHLFWMVQNPTQQQTFPDYWQIQKIGKINTCIYNFPQGTDNITSWTKDN